MIRLRGLGLVSHVAPIRVAVLCVLGLPLRHCKRVSVGSADCMVLEDGGRDVRRLGDSSCVRYEAEDRAEEVSAA